MADDRTIEILAQLCADMQAESLQGVTWALPHAQEFQRRARERLIAAGIDIPTIDVAGPAVTSILLTRLASALERIADALERE